MAKNEGAVANQVKAVRKTPFIIETDNHCQALVWGNVNVVVSVLANFPDVATAMEEQLPSDLRGASGALSELGRHFEPSTPVNIKWHFADIVFRLNGKSGTR